MKARTLAGKWRKLRAITAYVLMPISCLSLSLENAYAGKCSKIRLSAHCANTPHASRLKQIRSGRSANAYSTLKMLIRLNESEMNSDSRRKTLNRNNSLSGVTLTHPSDAQTAEILTQLGVPVFPGIPPVIILLPEDDDKNEDD